MSDVGMAQMSGVGQWTDYNCILFHLAMSLGAFNYNQSYVNFCKSTTLELAKIREPIKLTVDSYGGSVYCGNGLISAILTSKTPVWTYCYSKAMSMGQYTFIAGARRFIGPMATIMFHGVANNVSGYLKAIETTLDEGKRLETAGVKLTVSRTKVSREKLESIIKDKTEWYINPEEAIEYGFATDIL